MADRRSELAHEQRVVNERYTRLDELRARAQERLQEVRIQGPSGSPQNRSERDAFATLWEDRAAQLNAVEDRLVFGRLDLTPDAVGIEADPTTLQRYVGRIGLTDNDHHPILTDWRAPAAEPFYRATALEPLGVRRRRHIVTANRKVTGVEDELLDLENPEVGTGTLTGEGALLASLAQRRTGHMSDIVATIQAEQDRIIRADLAGALVVQGGPGTGKTAVALHRAAYLLYAHRRQLDRSGVLLIGPSPAFLRYIDQVLPSLGETGVISTTLGDLLPGITARAMEPDEVAEIKGRAFWVEALRRAVRARERVPERDLTFSLDGHRLSIRRRDVREAISRARRTHKPHNEARVTFVRDVLGKLTDQYAKASRRELSPEDRAIIREDLRSHRDVRVALNLAWFPLSAKRLVDDLWAKPHRLAQAAPELSEREANLLYRAPFAPWTEADVPLLDEAFELLGVDDTVARAEARAEAVERAEALEYARNVIASGGATGGAFTVDAELLAERFARSGPRLTPAERAALDRTWTYGHLVVDEAQELSPMAWRMLVRRVPTRSMTIVGDLAQTTSRIGAQSWAAALDGVLRGSWRLEELTVSYRTPAEVAQAAQAMATAAGLPVSHLTAAREVPDAIWDMACADPITALPQVIAKLAGEYLDAEGGGRVAVIAADEATALAAREELLASLPEVLGEATAKRLAEQRADEAQIPVLTPREAKGLEFDAVVLIEPLAIHETGASNLYVAMTRPTQRLVLVHARALPEGLASP